MQTSTKIYEGKGGLKAFLFFVFISALLMVGTADLYASEGASSGSADAMKRSAEKTTSRKISKKNTKKSSSYKVSFENPDFAFPKDVSLRALKEYNAAINNDNPLIALKAAMQLMVADRLTTTDSVGISLSRFADIQKRFKAPWNSIAALLQARLLSDVYSRDSWKFDNRKLPLQPLNQEPMLWSGQQFKEEILRLCKESLKDSNSLSDDRISLISGLLTDYQAAEKADLSVFDFVTYQVIDILQRANIAESQDSIIPFTIISKSGGSSEEDGIQIAESQSKVDTRKSDIPDEAQFNIGYLLNNLVADDERRVAEGSNADYALLWARISKMMHDNSGSQIGNDSLIQGYAKQLLELYPLNNPLRPIVIERLFEAGKFNTSSLKNRQEFFDILDESIPVASPAEYREALEAIMSQLLQPSVEVSTPYQWLSSKPGKISVRASNVRNANLLLVPISTNQGENRGLTYSQLKAEGVIRNLYKFSMESGSPSAMTDTIEVGPLSPGYYAIVPSQNEDLRGIFDRMTKWHPDIIHVSDLCVFVADNGLMDNNSEKVGRNYSRNADTYLYVVDGKNNSPIKGANVEFKSTSSSKGSQTQKSVTDKDGKVQLPFERCSAVITSGNNRLLWDGVRGYIGVGNDSTTQAQILTDLALYHPGDSIQCVVIVSECVKNVMSIGAGKNVTLNLYNANNEKVGSEELLTDDSGRAVASFLIPQEGLTGTFRLRAEIAGSTIGYQSVEVSEYKAPTFKVNLDSPDIGPDGCSIIISGNVISYSGMPMQNADVTLGIQWYAWWRPWIRHNEVGNEFSTKVSADSYGRFYLILSLPASKVADYEYGRFSVKAVVTSEAGETQESKSRSFAIGEGYDMTFSGKSSIEVEGREINLSVKVTDIVGNPVVKPLKYEIFSKDFEGKISSKPLLSGEFDSPNLVIPESNLPSGSYLFKVSLKDNTPLNDSSQNAGLKADTLSQDLIIFRHNDSAPPMITPLWTPKSTYYSRPDDSHVEVTVGSGYKDEYVMCQIADSKGILRTEWLRPEGKNIKVKVKTPADGEIVRLYFAGCHDLNKLTKIVNIYPPEASRKTLFKIDTFRDNLIPGDQEVWKFQLLSGWPAGDGTAEVSERGLSNVGEASVIAVMSNEALNAITPFNWGFSPRSAIYYHALGGLRYDWTSTVNNSYLLVNPRRVKSIYTIEIPNFNFWNQSLAYPSIFIRGTQMNKAMLSSTSRAAGNDMTMAEFAEEEASDRLEAAHQAVNNNAEVKMAKKESAYSGGVVTEEASEDDVSSENGYGADDNSAHGLEMRSMEMPLAFFKPLLTTDENGIAEVEFKVPNFNTTWSFQLLGYDKHLNSALIRESVVASKPVMVSTNMPRFLLTGDFAEITATVFNATKEKLEVTANIEIFEISSGNVIASHKMTYSDLAANSSATCSVNFRVPYNVGALGVRSVAVSKKGSDGEQTLLQVFPSSMPVRDATTFYLLPGCSEESIVLPEMKSRDSVTLNFCMNPEWFVLTALTGKIYPDSESALAQAVALYSNGVAGGLLKKNAKLRRGLEEMIEKDSKTLESPLSQNASLKLTELNYTPWLNNATAETERMQNLSSLLDESEMDKAIASCISALETTRNSDGSWSWMKGMPGSEWITRQVIACLGQMRISGYLPSDKRLSKMISGGVNFSDTEMSKAWRDCKGRKNGEFPLEEEISYIYERSSATDAHPSGAIAEMKRDLFRRMPKEWRSLSLLNKATSAILLCQEGGSANNKLAATIMESVKQFAFYKPDKGLWFDTSGNDWRSVSPLWLTARCLDAFRMVRKSAPESDKNSIDTTISGLEQYLILSRQTRDWNLELGQAGVAGVVNSLLGGNPEIINLNDEAGHSPSLEFFIDGEVLNIPADADALTGNFYMNLDAEKVSGKTLTIHRHGSVPAWGGIMSQYVAPAADVKAQSVPQLKITKELLPIEASAGQSVVGNSTDKFSKGERVRVSLTVETDRDLDYVMISDRLGAWMQPAEQLTRYDLEDGLWVLRETRRDKVNFYITKVPKGRYIISYEVNADRDGDYSTGIASAQSQYYPMISAHSAGCIITVEGR